ncbi:cytochrome P460 family protein [Dyella sp. Tek66A03]|uniref:cytochrome P460 family protein n=1 Tax=Dyella sp. Tek66A03 TaxID=3458298 RepID=UPI00403E3826
MTHPIGFSDAGSAMKRKRTLWIAGTLLMVATLGSVAYAVSAQDKYALKVPGGLAFSELWGYEKWQVVSVSEDGGLLAVVVANQAMIDAYWSGIPGNGKPFPDGSKMATVHWDTKKLETFPAATVPATQHDVDFMVKDSKRFADIRRRSPLIRHERKLWPWLPLCHR